jgi:hypothetical protein
MMSDLNFNQIPSEIKYFIPGKETVNDIPNLFGSLQEMKIPQVESRQRVKSLLYLASPPLRSSNFSERIFSTGSKLCLLCLDKIQSAHTR